MWKSSELRKSPTGSEASWWEVRRLEGQEAHGEAHEVSAEARPYVVFVWHFVTAKQKVKSDYRDPSWA